tara:strand:- start:7619 stop:11242 length:3624 start_codon:yes stop_codon:yes gene_type:complete
MSQFDYLFEDELSSPSKGQYDYLFQDEPASLPKGEKDYSMLDKLPDWVKQGYNQSMTGLIQQAATGEIPYDLSSLEPNVMRDFGAGLISFFMPADLVTFVGGFGLGGQAAKTAGKQALKQLIRGGVNKKLAKKITSEGMKDVIEKSGIAAAGGGTGLGTMGGINESLRQYIDKGEVDISQSAKRAGKDFVLGAATTGIGVGLSAKGYSALSQAGAETFTFGTLEPALEGKLPTPQDYVQAGATILGIRGTMGVAGGTYRAATGQPIIKPKISKSKPASKEFKEEVAEKLQKQREADRTDRKKQKWTSERKGFQDTEIVNERIAKNNRGMFDLKDRVSGKTLSLSKEVFYKEFDLYGKGYGREALAKKRLREVASISKQLLSKKYGLTKQFLSEKKKELFGTDNIASKNMTSRQLFKYREAIRKEKELIHLKKYDPIIKNLREFEPGKTLLEKVLPSSIYDRVVAAETLARGNKYSDNLINRILPKANQRRAEIVSNFVENSVRKTGLLRYKNQEAVSYALEGKKGKAEYYKNTGKRIPKEAEKIANQIRKELRKGYLLAKKSGVDVAGYIEDYFPRMMKRDIQEIIFDDLMPFYDKNKKLFDKKIYKKKDLAVLNNMIKKARDRGEFSRDTSRAIDKLVKEYNLSYKEALDFMKTEGMKEMYSPFGNLEKSRKYELPADFYERNAKEVLVRYFEKLGKRVGNAEYFGAKGQKAKALFKLMRNDPKSLNISKTIYNNYTGLSSIDPAMNFKNPSTRKIMQGYMSFEYGTKIGLGFSTIPNVTQSLISTIVEAGPWRFMKGAVRLFNPKTLEKIRRSGATLSDVKDILMGTDMGVNPRTWRETGRRFISEKGAVKRLANLADILTTVSLFKGMNYLNQLLAASTAEIFARDLHRIIRNTPKNLKGKTAKGKKLSVKDAYAKARYNWATKNLQKMGITDYSKAKLSNRNIQNAMFNFATESQLQRNILKEPMAFNDPRLRPLFIFKRFIYRQAKYQKDLMNREVSSGNVLAPLRLAAGGLLGAGFVNWATDGLVRFFSGEKAIREDKEWYDLIDAMGTVGALGFFSDLLSADEKLPAFFFAVTPTMLSTLDDGAKAAYAVGSNLDTYGYNTWAPFQRSLKQISKFGGSVTKQAAKRVETPSQKKNRIAQEKGKIRKRVFELYSENNPDKAMKLVEKFNNARPSNPIFFEEINFTEYYKWYMRKEIKKQNP